MKGEGSEKGVGDGEKEGSKKGRERVKGEGSEKGVGDTERKASQKRWGTLATEVSEKGVGETEVENGSFYCCAICGEACTDFVIRNLPCGLALEVQAHGLLISKVLEQLY